MLKVYDGIGALVHPHTRCVKLLTSVVPRVLDLVKVVVRVLQLTVMIRRRKCTIAEKSILLLQLLELVRDGSIVLIVCGQTHTLLHESSCGVMLQVEQVLRILGHRSHAGAEVRALEVRYGLKTLLPHRIFLILNQEKCDRHHCGSGEATLTQRGECDVGHLLDSAIGLTVNDGLRPCILLVGGDRHAGLAYVQIISHRQAASVDWDFPVVAKTKECIVEHLWEPRAMLAHGINPPILGEEEVGVVI
jgi:hypothetical protein